MQRYTDKNQIVTHEFKPLYHANQKIKTYNLNDLIKKSNYKLLEPNRINFYGFLFITEGEGKHIIDFKEIQIQAGDVIIISPGQIHAYVESDLLKGRVLAFHKDIFLSFINQAEVHNIFEILNQFSLKNLVPSNKSSMKKILKLIDLIENETITKFDNNQNHILQNLLLTIIYLLNRENLSQDEIDVKQSEKSLALKFKNLIIKNLNIKYNVDFFLSEMKISKKALQKATKNTFNLTPKMTIIELLVLESKRLLLDPEIQIQEVAYQLGFNEPTNYSKFFKKFTSLTPENFRKNSK